MNKNLLLFFAILLIGHTQAQNSFKNGYIIDMSDRRIDCLLMITTLNTNPIEVAYKVSVGGELKIATIKTIKEFGVIGENKYVSSVVQIDRSSKTISSDKIPNFQEDELFLKVLVEGKASLYEYVEDQGAAYFYSIGTKKIEQLVYKKYLLNNGGVGEKNTFRQQINNDLQCANLTKNKVVNLSYERNNLVNHFVAYNDCKGEDYINYEAYRKKLRLKLNLRPGIYSSSFKYKNSSPITVFRGTDLGNKLNFRFGIEAELFFSQKVDKWSVVFEPTYQSYTTNKKLLIETVSIDYSSIEIPLGIRRYFFLDATSKVFINASFMFDFPLESAISYDSNREDLPISELGFNLAFGLGYIFNDAYTLELRIHTDRDILSNYTYWQSNYKTASIILGYSLF